MENYLKIKNENCVQKGQICRCGCDGSEFCEHEEDHCGDCTTYAIEQLHEYLADPANYPAGRDMYISARNRTIKTYLPDVYITPEYCGDDADWDFAEAMADELCKRGYDVSARQHEFAKNVGVIAQFDWDIASRATVTSHSDEL